MARYPKAAWRPVIGLAKDPAITPIGVILHVDGGNSSSLYRYFNGLSGGIESHLFLTDAPKWEQYRDTTREADANYRGNSWVGSDGKRYGFISVETRGLANGEWSPAMLDEIKAFLLWAHQTHGIPLRVAPGYHSAGVGYHVMFGAGAGLNAWSNAAGKVCPGPNRIRQFREILVPWMAEVTAAESRPTVAQADSDRETPTAPTAPKFPLPAGHWFGPKSVNPRNHSGFYSAKDRARLIVWQKQMVRRGHTIDCDGRFGDQSKRAAVKLQTKLGLKADGLVGAYTWRAAWEAK
jgi:peptidoglycan hydrolase-like protein with peptidoglycan-binding domain